MEWKDLKKWDLKSMYNEYKAKWWNIWYWAFLRQIHNVGYDMDKVKNKPEYHKLYDKYKAKWWTFSIHYFRELCKKMHWEDIPLKTKWQATEESIYYNSYEGDKISYSVYLKRIRGWQTKEQAIFKNK